MSRFQTLEIRKYSKTQHCFLKVSLLKRQMCLYVTNENIMVNQIFNNDCCGLEQKGKTLFLCKILLPCWALLLNPVVLRL